MIYKYMTSISKNVCIDKSDGIVNKYSSIYHRTIKMKSADIKSNAESKSSKEINDKDPKFKISDIVRISKYKKIFWQKITFLKCSKLVWRSFCYCKS